MPAKVDWFMGETATEKKTKMVQMLRANKEALDHLSEVVDKRIKEGTNLDDYDIPNWPYWQADRNGYNRALKYVKELIKSLEE